MHTPTKSNNAKEHWHKARRLVGAIVNMQRPVSRQQRIGKSPIYKQGIVKEDFTDINIWFGEASRINEIKKKEHRALYTGKIVMRRTPETWNRPGMPFLPTIRSTIVNDFLADNIARAEQRMMVQGAKEQVKREQREQRQREEMKEQKEIQRYQKKQQQDRIHEQPPPPKEHTIAPPQLPALSALSVRKISLWDKGSRENHQRILTRGVKMCGTFFVLTVSRLSVDARELGLQFVAQQVTSKVAASPASPPTAPPAPSPAALPSSDSSVHVFVSVPPSSPARPSSPAVHSPPPSPSPPSPPSTTSHTETATMRMSWSALTSTLYAMGRASLAERCLHCVTFPSPEFEIQARSFACAAFMMRRVTVARNDQGTGWVLVLNKVVPPPVDVAPENDRVEQDLGTSIFLTSTSSAYGGSSAEEDEEDGNNCTSSSSSMVLPSQLQPHDTSFGGKPYFPNSLASLPPRAGALRTALHPDHNNWHTTKSRLELKSQDPVLYHALRPQLRQVLPLPSSLTSPHHKKQKRKKRRPRKRAKTESWVTPYGDVSYGNGNIAFRKKNKKKTKRPKKKHTQRTTASTKQSETTAAAGTLLGMEEQLEKELRNHSRLEARRAFVLHANDPNISEEHRNTLLNGAATIDRLRELDGFRVISDSTATPATSATPAAMPLGTSGERGKRTAKSTVRDKVATTEGVAEDDRYYFKKNKRLYDAGGEEEDRDAGEMNQQDGTPSEDMEAEEYVNATLMEVEQELHTENDILFASTAPPPRRSTMTTALMQKRLEAVDALEAVARFNSQNNFVPAPLLPLEHSASAPSFRKTHGKGGQRRSGGGGSQWTGIYIPSSDSDSEEEDKMEHNAVVQAEKKDQKDRNHHDQHASMTSAATAANQTVTTPHKTRKQFRRIECSFPIGPLGLSLGDCSTTRTSTTSDNTTVVIIAVEEHCPKEAKQVLKMGDVVDQIGNVCCEGLPFQKILTLIRSAERPVEIVFRRVSSSGPVEPPIKKVSPRSRTFVEQPGLVQSPPMPAQNSNALMPVELLLRMEENKNKE